MSMTEAIFQATAWTSERTQGLPRNRDRLLDAYDDNQAWQDYLKANRPEGLHFIAVFDERKQLNIWQDRHRVHIGVPVDEFKGTDPTEAMASVVQRVYEWAADRFGWPPPPA